MSGTNVLWGQIVIVGLIVLIAIWSSATQWTTGRLGFQPQLGLPWFMFTGCLHGPLRACVHLTATALATSLTRGVASAL